MRETACDVLVVGGGTGGVAAALAATSLGCSVILTEETSWVGGQLTSQAVPPDEHPWIESFGCTARYRRYREAVRQYYRDHTPLTTAAKSSAFLNPGGGWVSAICHEPRVGWQVLNQMMQPALGSGRLDLRLHRRPVDADASGDDVRHVRLLNLLSGDEEDIRPKFVLDATETGELLPLTLTEYVIGAESRRDTHEPNAIDGDDEPDNVQGLTWVFAMAQDEGSHRVIDEPEGYATWRAFRPEFWPGPLIGFDDLNPVTNQPRHLPLFGNHPNLFTYRQIVNPAIFSSPYAQHPVTIVNWPMNDYFTQTILDVSEDAVHARLGESRQLSLSLLYWLQTEAPRHDGGVGYPGLYLRPDITGTEDGFAMAPYIRESRRIVARTTVYEQDVATISNPGRDRGREYADSVGVGAYRIDLHPSTNGKPYIDTSSLPFEIPLGALIPVRMRNLLAAAKNIGTTHITNGCYRLHPVEWNIGESAGLLAAYCVQGRREPAEVHESPELVAEFQRLLHGQGVQTKWPRLHSL
jgi:hypothetical protein